MSKAKYPYYTPNLGFRDLFQCLFFSKSQAHEIIVDYFRNLTGKKHILITNSCRTALYLAWQCIGKSGEVITSPLTCKVAIDPIIEAEQKVVFADVNIEDLNMDPASVENKITNNTIAIQAIHLGGSPCDMDELTKLAAKNNLKIIEDCAQSLGSYYKSKPTGSFGDIVCFSLIKNAYGIGGGILATNDEQLFQKAKKITDTYDLPSKTLILFRVLKNMADSQRKNLAGRILYKLVLKIKGSRRSYDTVKGQLRKITDIELKIAGLQLKKYTKLHSLRKNIGNQYVSQLLNLNLLKNRKISLQDSSFTKFFVYHPDIDSYSHLSYLKAMGIEAMHLEQRTGSPVQERLVSEENSIKLGLENYNSTHNHIISLPICEWFKVKHVHSISNKLQKIIAEK